MFKHFLNHNDENIILIMKAFSKDFLKRGLKIISRSIGGEIKTI